MKRGGKSGGPEEREENLGEKLRRGAAVGKRGGQQTPVLPPWRQLLAAGTGSDARDSSFIQVPFLLPPPPPLVSARKLAATLWELHNYGLPLSKMNRGGPSPPPRLRCLHHRHLHPDKALDLLNPSPSSPDLMEPYNPVIPPTTSLEFERRIGETGYSFKTSTKLIKVLNRIWILEEQQTSNMSLMKALKKELNRAHARIKMLVRDQQVSRHMMEDLRNQIAENKLVRKSKEQDRISAAIKSVTDELEDERKLRKRSEGLHRKLAWELYEVKTSLADAVKELETEREHLKLLEDLCDEFAWGIKDYEQGVRALKQEKLDEDWVDRDACNQLILHFSKSWLDERMQMKLGGQHSDDGEKNSVADKLSSEIKTFLGASDGLAPRGTNLHRRSLNAAGSAPHDAGNEEDSSGRDSHCFELNRQSVGGLKPCEDEPEDNRTHDRAKPNHPTRFLAEVLSCNESEPQVVNDEQRKIAEKSEIRKATEESDEVGKNHADSRSSPVIDELISSQYLLSEARHVHPEMVSSSNSAWRRRASPVTESSGWRQWTATLPSHHLEITESSSKLPPEVKENTLKVKLLEARTRGQQSRPGLKVSKASF